MAIGNCEPNGVGALNLGIFGYFIVIAVPEEHLSDHAFKLVCPDVFDNARAAVSQAWALTILTLLDDRYERLFGSSRKHGDRSGESDRRRGS